MILNPRIYLEIIDFPSGLYAMALSIDEDDESIKKVQNRIYQWLKSTNFELDEHRSFMFNMPYLDEENQYQQDIEKDWDIDKCKDMFQSS